MCWCDFYRFLVVTKFCHHCLNYVWVCKYTIYKSIHTNIKYQWYKCCLVTKGQQNIFFCVLQYKQSHTGLVCHEGELKVWTDPFLEADVLLIWKRDHFIAHQCFVVKCPDLAGRKTCVKPTIRTFKRMESDVEFAYDSHVKTCLYRTGDPVQVWLRIYGSHTKPANIVF